MDILQNAVLKQSTGTKVHFKGTGKKFIIEKLNSCVHTIAPLHPYQFWGPSSGYQELFPSR